MNLRQKAWEFAQKKHANQNRVGGGPYAVHPYVVALFLVARGHEDDELIAAAYLHDTIEDTDTTFEELEKEFGLKVARIVQELTCKREEGETHKAKTIRMADGLAHASDEAKLIKLADRLHNLKTIDAFPEWKQERYRNSTFYLLERIGGVDFELHKAILKEIGKGKVL
jgi:(p)ppGpp synthase/HD superfamily hydrolase